MNKFKIGILGNMDDKYQPHYTLNNCLKELQEAHYFDFEWIPTELLADDGDPVLNQYDGIIAGSGPYHSKIGVINGIRFARKNNVPFLGTCSGFGYAVLEFGQSIFGLATVHHPYEGIELKENENFLQPLNYCNTGMHTINFRTVEGTLAKKVYNETGIKEESHCIYGVNSHMIPLFEKEGLIVSGYDDDNEPKMMEYNRNDFFIITLFLPQFRSSSQKPHPLLSAYLKATGLKNAAHNINQSISLPS